MVSMGRDDAAVSRRGALVVMVVVVVMPMAAVILPFEGETVSEDGVDDELARRGCGEGDEGRDLEVPAGQDLGFGP